MSTAIPIIDCSKVISCLEDYRALRLQVPQEDFVQQLGDGMTSSGFVYFVNHGLDSRKVTTLNTLICFLAACIIINSRVTNKETFDRSKECLRLPESFSNCQEILKKIIANQMLRLITSDTLTPKMKCEIVIIPIQFRYCINNKPLLHSD